MKKNTTDKIYDICIINGYHENPLSYNWFTFTKELGKNCLIVTPNYNEYLQLSSQGVDVVYLLSYSYNKPKNHQEVINYLKEMGINDWRDFMRTEKSYYLQSDESIAKYAYIYGQVCEQLFQTHQIKRIVQFQGGEVVRRMAHIIAEKHGVLGIFLGESFIPHRINLYSDEYKTKIYPKNVSKLSEEEAQEVIDNRVHKKKVIKYDVDRNNYKTTNTFTKFLNLIKAGNWNAIIGYFTYKWLIIGNHGLKQIYTKLKSTFKPFNPNEKFYYYPFNVSAESELFIRNPKYSHQGTTIEQLSKALPADTKLYTKIHPGHEGHLTVKEYQQLKKLKNVVLIDPSVSSFDIIDKAQAVIIVSSTVGLEAYLLGKKVAVLGNWPYVKLGNFVEINDIKDTFTKIENHKGKNEPVKFIQNLHELTVDGSIYEDSQQLKNFIKELVHV